MKHLRRLAFASFAVLFITSAAFADPPSRVVRLKYMSGQVSIQPGGVDDWVAASINRPLTTADRVWTDKDSRAELHLGTSAMRMNSETSLTLANVADNTVQVELHQGTLNLRVVQLYEGEIYEVDTPNLAFTVLKSGSYRFDVDADGDTTAVTVWKGEGEATGDGPGVRLHAREQAQFSGGRSLVHEIASAPGLDGFDDWCRVRDAREDRAMAVRYVPRGVIGYEDLDDYGEWVAASPYGHIWVPASVAVGWAPYRYGHWIWVEPWGWTWVDDAPWGFAPFHYGRWVHYHGRWGWCPGPVVVRPYYAPALVAWVGGSSWGVGLSFGVGGGVGWFPLGWGEPYVPHYRVSRNYFQNVNVTNTHITNITYVTNNYYNNKNRNITRIKYVNERVNGAVTAVPRHTFENSRPIAREAVFVDRKHMGEGSIVADPGLRPSRNSMLGVHAGGHTAVPPRGAVGRPVVSRLPQPPGHERSGEERQARGRDERRSPDNRAERVVPRPGANAGRHDEPRPGSPVAREAPHRPDRPGVPEATAGPDASGPNRREPVPRPHGRNAEAGPPESTPASGHVVPRPPERNPRTWEAEGRNKPPLPANAGDARRGPRDDARAERPVPRPPERYPRPREVEAQGPAAPAPGNAGIPRRSRDNAPPELATPRLPERPRASSPMPRREAEERPVPRPSAPPNVQRDAGPAREPRAADRPRQESRPPEISRPAPPAHRESVSQPNRNPDAGRERSRPAEKRRSAPSEDRGKPDKDGSGPHADRGPLHGRPST